MKDAQQIESPVEIDDAGPADPAGSPSAEALFALRVAGEVARQLFEAGRELRFAVVPAPQRVDIALCDLNGRIVSRLTPARVIEIATGEPVRGATR